MERIERESFGLFCPELADIFVRREPLEGLQALGEIVGTDEVSEMAAKLVVSLIVKTLDGRIFDSAVHPFDLTIGPRVPGLGETVIDVVAGAGYLESMGPEWLLSLNHVF